MSFSLSVPVLLSLMECQRLEAAPAAHRHGRTVSFCNCPAQIRWIRCREIAKPNLPEADIPKLRFALKYNDSPSKNNFHCGSITDVGMSLNG